MCAVPVQYSTRNELNLHVHSVYNIKQLYKEICKQLNIMNLWQVLKRYRESNSKLDTICRADPSAHEDCVAVLPYEMFDTLDLQNVNYYTGYCNQFAAAMNNPPKVCIVLIL